MAGFNPMYNNGYGTLYNGQSLSNPMIGYQERMAQLQQQYSMNQPIPQQYMQPVNGLSGKVVDSIDVVRATDIPMDGNCYYFPKADGTEVYAKRWLPTGKTEVLVYKPSIEEEAVPQEPAFNMQALCDDIVNKLNGIDERIGKIEKSLGSKPVVGRNTKKEDVE